METAMRRWGAILMILGVNLAVASVTAAFWRASYECAVRGTDGTCPEGAVRLFINQMVSVDGIFYWLVIIVGALVFWRGIRMRSR